MAAERRRDQVIARLRPQLGDHRVAVELLHRVLLQRPDAVVADRPSRPPPRAGPACRAPSRRSRRRRRRRAARPDAQGRPAWRRARTPAPSRDSRRARGRPSSPGRERVDDAAGERDEVTAVADHDRVPVEHRRQLAVDPHRVQRRPRVGQVGRLRRPALPLGRTERRKPTPTANPQAHRPLPNRTPPAAPQRRRQRPVQLSPPPAADATAPAARRRSPPPTRPPRRCRRSPSRKSIGTPITSARSHSPSARPRVRENASGSSAGRQPRASPFRNTGNPQPAGQRASACSPRPQ